MQAVEDIFRIWESTTQMAEAIGEKPDTVFRWRRRGRIPEHALGAVCAAAKERGRRLTVAKILALNTPMKPRGAAAPSHPNYRPDAA